MFWLISGYKISFQSNVLELSNSSEFSGNQVKRPRPPARLDGASAGGSSGSASRRISSRSARRRTAAPRCARSGASLGDPTVWSASRTERSCTAAHRCGRARASPDSGRTWSTCRSSCRRSGGPCCSGWALERPAWSHQAPAPKGNRRHLSQTVCPWAWDAGPVSGTAGEGRAPCSAGPDWSMMSTDLALSQRAVNWSGRRHASAPRSRAARPDFLLTQAGTTSCCEPQTQRGLPTRTPSQTRCPRSSFRRPLWAAGNRACCGTRDVRVALRPRYYSGPTAEGRRRLCLRSSTETRPAHCPPSLTSAPRSLQTHRGKLKFKRSRSGISSSSFIVWFCQKQKQLFFLHVLYHMLLFWNYTFSCIITTDSLKPEGFSLTAKKQEVMRRGGSDGGIMLIG